MTRTAASLIDTLVTAHQQGRPVAAAPWAGLLRTEDDAYLVQAAVGHELGWFDGGAPRHWKSGGASRAATLGHSPLPPKGIWSSPAALAAWPWRRGGIEAEIALRLAVDVDANLAATLDVERAEALVDAMCVAVELVDSRWDEAFSAPPLLRLADLQSHSALALGDWVPYQRRDWPAQSVRITVNDRPPQTWSGTHSCGDPAWVLPAWLRHVTRDGQGVSAGTVVTTGTWCGVLKVQPDEAVGVEFDGIGLVRMSF